MGRLNNGGEDQKTFLKHSSHDHRLELTCLVNSDWATCFGCNSVIPPGTHHLSCRACEFYLHRECFDFPERIRHPADDHVLVLDTSSAPFLCKACGSYRRGFSYRCSTCGQGFHCVCTTKPLSVTDHSVHEHELRLCFKPPYDGENGFRCDLCNREGYSWLYCCQGCHFDVHLDYAKCKAAVLVAGNMAITCATGDIISPVYRTETRNVQNLVPGNFPMATNQVVGCSDGMNVTTTSSPINNTSLPPVNPPQLGPNGSYGYSYGQGGRAPNIGQAYGNNDFVHLQSTHLQPNSGAPMNILQPNPGFSYGAPMMAYGYRQEGMKGRFVGGIAGGLGEGMGQGVIGVGMEALGIGNGGDQGGAGMSDFVDSYAGEWA